MMGYPHYLIEDLLSDWRDVIGEDFEKYRNHVYRVFLNCRLQDSNPANLEKYALAAVFHDIGIWIDHTIDYLDPSVYHLRQYLSAKGKAESANEISSMVYWHHKIGTYHGDFEYVTETFRRADWADVSFGIISFGLDTKALAYNRKQLPNKGFHVFLIRKLLTNLLRKPLNPLPMFRW